MVHGTSVCCNSGEKIKYKVFYGELFKDPLNNPLKGEPLEEVIVLSTWGRKWRLMDDVKGMLYTE